MPPKKGAIIVSNGNGKVTFIDPSENPGDDALMPDNDAPNGLKWGKSLAKNKIFKTAVTNTSTFSSTSYQRVTALSIPGSSTVNIKDIIIISSMKNGTTTSYTVRVLDLKNVTTICEQTFTNTISDINKFSILNNLPINPSIFEFQIKVEGNQNREAYIDEITITHDESGNY